VSGLDSLPPDQRAVLQLILVQGRGYADLAATLRLDAAAVRERAHAGAATLAGTVGADLDAGERGRVVDYLLGQQDEGERIVTYAALGDSPAVCSWAQQLRERLAPVAREELPEVPASATVAAAVNGSSAPAAIDPAVPDPVATTAALAALPPAPVRPRATHAGPATPAPPAAPPPAPRPTSGDGPSGPRPSRLGGAILIAGVLAVVVVLAIVLIGGGNDSGGSASTNSAQTQARTTPRTQTSTTAARAQARTVGGAVLRSPTGGSGLAAALVQQGAGGRRLLAVEAARLPANAGTQFYAIWLQGKAGNRFLGFVPRQVRSDGTFTVSSTLPNDLTLSSYSTVLVTVEDGNASAAPTTPGTTVLSGPLRLAG